MESQALAADSCILNLAGKVNAALSGARDGILTKDYIYLADGNNTVIRRSHIMCALLEDCVIYTTVNKKRTPMHYLNILIVSDKGVRASAETTKEAGRALQALLLEQNSNIDIRDGSVLTEKGCEEYIKERLDGRV